jgi:hypothetical protein
MERGRLDDSTGASTAITNDVGTYLFGDDTGTPVALWMSRLMIVSTSVVDYRLDERR